MAVFVLPFLPVGQRVVLSKQRKTTWVKVRKFLKYLITKIACASGFLEIYSAYCLYLQRGLRFLTDQNSIRNILMNVCLKFEIPGYMR